MNKVKCDVEDLEKIGCIKRRLTPLYDGMVSVVH